MNGKGAAYKFLMSSGVVLHEVMSDGALFVPSYKQNMFSVQAAVKKAYVNCLVCVSTKWKLRAQHLIYMGLGSCTTI